MITSYFAPKPSVIMALILPGLLFFFLGIFFPLIMSFWLGFTNFEGFGTAQFIGFENYRRIFLEDRIFWISLRNALFLGLGYIFIQHPIAILLSFLVDRMSPKKEQFFRSVIFLPSVISIVVSVRLWVQILNPNFGLLNTFLNSIGASHLTRIWLGDTQTVLPAVILMSIWIGFGYAFLFYYAGIKGIDKQLYEAAQIDGASTGRILFYITLPLLKPVIRVNVVLAMINALKQMEIIFLSTNGGPGNASQFIANYLYNQAFLSSRYGYANAISAVFAVVCIVLTLVTQRLIREK